MMTWILAKDLVWIGIMDCIIMAPTRAKGAVINSPVCPLIITKTNIITIYPNTMVDTSNISPLHIQITTTETEILHQEDLKD